MPVTKNLATNDREWKALLHGKDPNVVRTRSDWKKLVASKESPLAQVDKRVVAAFTRKLKFKNGGLAHADFSMLAGTVPFSKFRRLWEHFGMSLELFADHEGYTCSGRGNCKKMNENICTSNC